MVVFFYIFVRLLIIGVSGWLIWMLLKGQNWQDIVQTIRHGFETAIKSCGFHTHQTRYPVELYKWVVLDEEDVSDECLERTIWPEMDIADWMQAGLPNTPEGPCQRGKECKCKLILYKQTRSPQNTG
ncbi:MAG: hypothetical protein KC684_03660 [Candidatus Omnitrophica bacterium]|nr:hypothetical protein [Candidatus Omnitrophota bacterium]